MTDIQTKFGFCVEYVLGNEGGYSDIPEDKGGCTNYGLTLADFRTLPNNLGINNCEDLKHLSLSDAKKVYYLKYWHFEMIDDWRVAAKCMDIFVNLPPNGAHRIMQTAANVCGSRLLVDGIWGERTQNAINSRNPEIYLDELCNQLHRYYEKIVEHNPKQAIFIKGWLGRAHRLPPMVK